MRYHTVPSPLLPLFEKECQIPSSRPNSLQPASLKIKTRLLLVAARDRIKVSRISFVCDFNIVKKSYSCTNTPFVWIESCKRI